MTLRTNIAGIAAAAAFASAAAPAVAARCTPARAGASVVSHPEPFRRAVEALVRSSAAEGKPWSCTGGVIELVDHEDGAKTLTILGEDGGAVSRTVISPDEIVPLGEALLAKPLPSPSTPEALVTARAPDVGPDRESPATVTPAPRLLFSALVSPRYAGSVDVLWLGSTAALAVPLGPWAAGVWTRYDAIAAAVGDGNASLRELCFGTSVSRSFALRPLELRASVVPSIAIVTWPGRETRVDGRIGAELRGVLPLTRWLRAAVAFDAELTPRELGVEKDVGGGTETTTVPENTGDDDGDDDDGVVISASSPLVVPPLVYPGYTLGLSIGLEVAFQ
ncbi:hypothetical protein [Sorangium sp. So ce1389]|uniref:hypothetical protein n=1 Tax=Sorangium sp. So ce1389 TaxID=3133336 RepID=UPI003F63AA85